MLRGGHGLIKSTISGHLRTFTQLRFTDIRAYSSDDKPTHNVAILGGGITGLACAYYLSKELPKASITIFEASDRIGGWLSSKRVPVKDGTVLFEAGPRTLRPSANGVLSSRLLQELDLAKDAIFAQNTSPGARNRYVYYPDHLVRMPHPSFGIADNLWSLMTEPVFAGTTWGIAGEFWRDARDEKVEDESVGDFFSRRFSKNTVDRILSAVIHGIYAGDVYQLSAKSLFPGLWRDEAESGGIFSGLIRTRADGLEVTKREAGYLQEMKNYDWDPLLKATLKGTSVFTFKDGLGMLVDRLARHLLEKGNIEFKTSTPVSYVRSTEGQTGISIQPQESEQPLTFTHAISALSPYHLNRVAAQAFDPGRSDPPPLIPAIPSVTVMTVNLYYRTPGLNPPGFGYVIPQATPFENNPERALGVVFDTGYAPSPTDLDLKRGTKLTVMLGGHWWNGWPSFPDEKEGLALAQSVVQRHLGITEQPEAWQVNMQKDCISQYTVGHEKKLKTAHSNLLREYKGRLRVAGSWMSGVGVNDCLRSAWDAARSLKEGREGTGLEHIGTKDYVRIKPIRPGQAQEK
ncbi:hypothetical protein BAUCODRAFT_71155 [Baudoinia panamericana UAMH 10762]|uniref:Protoporphyrinogen oxidase n=1 Tax=Baudoinia panamericana (strain UAMH 10762) TaxID=717646 RepID=M2LN19_BAUPA|nr:uncharacterized protein BAUCODRAFT_71155 [Baudoinia panamericana UAMH 10762]EMC95737.1 hypothetical protein BAUCODRAFT_71155 [Baudoinia panamericana UAMH 10762]